MVGVILFVIESNGKKKITRVANEVRVNMSWLLWF